VGNGRVGTGVGKRKGAAHLGTRFAQNERERVERRVRERSGVAAHADACLCREPYAAPYGMLVCAPDAAACKSVRHAHAHAHTCMHMQTMAQTHITTRSRSPRARTQSRQRRENLAVSPNGSRTPSTSRNTTFILAFIDPFTHPLRRERTLRSQDLLSQQGNSRELPGTSCGRVFSHRFTRSPGTSFP
jgi:hypothetical protein